MTIDEAIKHCEEVAERKEFIATALGYPAKDGERSECIECAADHRQLAEWLTDYKKLREEVRKMKLDLDITYAELAEAKRLLKLAVEDINAAEACDTCEYYPVINGAECQKDDCYKWRYADEALKLLGGNENG